MFGDLPHFTVHDDGSLTWPHMDGDDDQLMYIPDEIDTSGLRFKSGSGDQHRPSFFCFKSATEAITTSKTFDAKG